MTGELVLFLFSTWSTHQNNHFSSSSSTTFYNFGIFLHFFFLSFCFWAGPLHWTFLWGETPGEREKGKYIEKQLLNINE